MMNTQPTENVPQPEQLEFRKGDRVRWIGGSGSSERPILGTVVVQRSAVAVDFDDGIKSWIRPEELIKLGTSKGR
jgi:hypothetical protein